MFGGMNELFYPMSADVYYATQTQNDFGEIVRSWDMDRTIKCSAVKPILRNPNFVYPSTSLEYDITINFRTNEDIQVSSDNSVYRVTDIIISNIRDTAGNIIWKEDANNPTIFEINAVEPMFDISSVVMGHKIMCVRADNQAL